MGMFSYECKECGHPLLSPEATDDGINNWMSHGVALFEDGGRAMGTYDGYGRLGSTEELDGAACLHRACWEKAGKPEFDHYGEGSKSAADQGWFFDDGAHDMLDPRITENQDRILAQGKAKRETARYDQKAREVGEAVSGLDAFRARFSFMQCHEAGEKVEGKYLLIDKYREFFNTDADAYLTNCSEGDVKALLAQKWDAFLASDEGKKLLARWEEMRKESLARYVADLQEKGRYEVGYGRSKAAGDVVEGHKCERQRFYVTDKLTYKDVAEFDYEGTPGTYAKVKSPEWDARVEENRAESRCRRRMADAEAKRLNDAWAQAGFPVDAGVLAGLV